MTTDQTSFPLPRESRGKEDFLLGGERKSARRLCYTNTQFSIFKIEYNGLETPIHQQYTSLHDVFVLFYGKIENLQDDRSHNLSCCLYSLYRVLSYI